MEKWDFFHICHILTYYSTVGYGIAILDDGMILSVAGRLQNLWVRVMTNGYQATLYRVRPRGAMRNDLIQE